MRMTLPILALASLCAGQALAQDEDWQSQSIEDRKGELCVSITHIDRTDILDDETILFYMRGRTHYVNNLPHRCPSLEFEDTFMYSTPLSQLCNTDIITVLRRGGGTGFIQGPACGLGKFVPITRDEAKELTKAASDAKKAKRKAKKEEKKGDG